MINDKSVKVSTSNDCKRLQNYAIVFRVKCSLYFDSMVKIVINKNACKLNDLTSLFLHLKFTNLRCLSSGSN